MNGRTYIAALGRMMSADPFIQDPDSLQSYNRYSYCMNNPVICTDPSGYFSWGKLFKFVAIAAVSWGIGSAFSTAFMNSAWAAAGNTMTAEAFFAAKATAGILGGATGGFTSGLLSSGGDLGAALKGAVTGGLFGAAGGVTPLDAGSPERLLAHAGAGCVSGVLGGGGCGRGAASAVAGKIFTNLSENPIAAVVAGGTVSVIGGGKFGNGAVTAAFGYLFNNCVANPTGCFRAVQSFGNYFVQRWGPTMTQIVTEFGAAEGVMAQGLGPAFSALRVKVADEVAKGLTNAHHAWPKYMGGPESQDLVDLPQSLHRAYHVGLDQIANRFDGASGFNALSAAQRASVLTEFQSYTKWFDRTFGTNLMGAASSAGFRCPGGIPGRVVDLRNEGGEMQIPVTEVGPRHFEKFSVWKYVEASAVSEVMIQAVTDLPVGDPYGHIFAVQGTLKCGEKIWLVLTGVDIDASLSSITKQSYLYNDIGEKLKLEVGDGADEAIARLEEFVGRKLDTIFPIAYSLEKLVVGIHGSAEIRIEDYLGHSSNALESAKQAAMLAALKSKVADTH